MFFAGHRSGGRDDLLSVFSKKGIQRHHGTDFPKPLRSFMWTKENPSHTRLKETKVRALELERSIRGFLHSDGEKINSVQVELNRQRTLTATKERNFDSHRNQFSNWSNLSNHLFKERTHGDSLDTTPFSQKHHVEMWFATWKRKRTENAANVEDLQLQSDTEKLLQAVNLRHLEATTFLCWATYTE